MLPAVIHPRVESGLLRRADPRGAPTARAARTALLAQATTGTAMIAPKIPNSSAAGGQGQDHGQGMDPHVSSDHERLEGVGFDLVVEHEHRDHDQAATNPWLRPATPTASAPVTTAPTSGTKLPKADQHGQREGQRHAQDGQGDEDHDAVEGRHDQRSSHVVAQRLPRRPAAGIDVRSRPRRVRL